MTTIKEDLTALRMFIAAKISDGFDGSNTWDESEELTETGMNEQPWNAIEFDFPAKPAVTFALQNIPATPAPNTIAIQLATQRTEKLTESLSEVRRTYQIVYFGSSNIDVIDTADLIQRELAEETKLQVGAEWITLGAFSLSQGFKTENNVEAILGVLEVTAYQTRNTPTTTKVATVQMNIKTKE